MDLADARVVEENVRRNVRGRAGWRVMMVFMVEIMPTRLERRSGNKLLYSLLPELRPDRVRMPEIGAARLPDGFDILLEYSASGDTGVCRTFSRHSVFTLTKRIPLHA